MVGPIPDKLKKLDLGRFAQRASQLDRLKPIVAYWCYYWILHQILAKGMQSEDAECTAYATSLMDHVEQIKSEYGSEDAIIDDVAGQAYVEQFGLETFGRAEKAMIANKVTKQTADTLLAAATFLELVQIWTIPSQDLASKIKYAKFHALRIVRAVKAGEDPNLTNPPPPEVELSDLQDEAPLDPNDPEVQKITGTSGLQASVADAPDDDLPSSSTAVPRTAHDQPSSFISPPAASTEPDISPSNPRSGSVGGGYFPEIPSAPSNDDLGVPPAVSQPPSQPPTSAPAGSPGAEDFYASAPPPAVAPPTAPMPIRAPAPTTPAAAPTPKAAPIAVPPPAPPSTAAVPAGSFNANPDDAAVAEAQKSARWAISALNFEDVQTAVSELRHALRLLGAS